jgi:hypothetical protein
MSKGFAAAFLAALIAAPAFAGTDGLFDEQSNTNTNGVINVTASVPKRVEVSVQDCAFGNVLKTSTPAWHATCAPVVSVVTNTNFTLSWTATQLTHNTVNGKKLSTRYVISTAGQGNVTIDPDTTANDNGASGSEFPATDSTALHDYDVTGANRTYTVSGTADKMSADVTPRAGAYSATITIAITA